MKRAMLLGTLLSSLALGGCHLGARYYPVRTHAEVDPINVWEAPPPKPHHEYIRPARQRHREHHTWMHGQYVRNWSGYHWVEPRWVSTPWPGAIWHEGHYDSARGWWWPGYWR